ncbi:hypothetical protein CEXT_148661 [Caerostris extrusa]|uniref:CUB domain-containing protein n=1 Tax=Caerostris extrusa TaxID=172846 RepID=A0AAV4US13_CAEEX|nr:hypothetical protein CEXT_148661 [Caerostris extrusa]
MGILMLVYLLLLEYISFSIYQADAIIYLEDTCFPGQSKYLQIAVDKPHESEISYVEYIFASRTGTYSAGINCTVRIYSAPSYDVILNVKKIRYKPGCEDYLQIFDGVKAVGLCGFKDEHDSNMQFYGKEFLLHYFTGSETSQVLGLNGFSLSLTISRKVCYAVDFDAQTITALTATLSVIQQTIAGISVMKEAVVVLM